MVKKILEKGFFSSEFFRGILLYGLAAYAISKGYTAKEVSGVVGAVAEKLQQNKEMLVTVAALLAPMVDNLFYTKKRTDLKQKKMEESNDKG